MPPDSSLPLLTLAFGDAAGGVWGAGWFAGPNGSGTLILGGGDTEAALSARLMDASETWRILADGLELELVRTGEAVSLPDGENSVGYAQLGRVTGTVAGHPVDVPACRGEMILPDLSRLDSVREVAVWFPAGDGVAAMALRPRKHKGHEQDVISAAVLGEDEPMPISDPRLSTTYTADGRPTRFNLELWPEDPERYARRIAGESTGHSAAGAASGWQVHVELLRCHSHGEDGAGVYLLARPG